MPLLVLAGAEGTGYCGKGINNWSRATFAPFKLVELGSSPAKGFVTDPPSRLTVALSAASR